MSLQRFDTLVCGDDLSGLIAANLLSHFNYKVVVLRNSVPADRYLYKGYALPVSPFLLPPLRFGELLSQIRQYLSLSQSEFEEDAEIVDKFQYITRRLRLDVCVDKNGTAEEFFCELGVKKERMYKFFDSVNQLMEELTEIFNRHSPYPPYSFWDKRKMKENYFAEYSKKPSVFECLSSEREKCVFRSILSFITNTETSKTSPAQEALLGYLFFERWLLLPSIERIRSLLVKRLEERGNLILGKTEDNFSVEKRGFGYYLRDEKRQSSFRIDSFILSADSDFLSCIMPAKRFEKLNLPYKNYKIRYTTNFVAESDCIPEVASKYIIYNRNPEKTDASNLFQVSVSKAIKGRAIIKENKIISVTTFIKPDEFKKKNSEDLNKRAHEVLIDIFPFADEYLLNTSSVLDAEYLLDVNMNEITKTDYRYNQYLFTDYTLRDGILLCDMKTGIDNFINSFSVFAPIGIYGDFMAAVRAAEIISKNVAGK
ncbi:MAG: hypothetical protein N3B13_01100 [Deltaproteobacteria bacterium]|nr:hypothetical protein [Deltaproteobacteria bacterium]